MTLPRLFSESGSAAKSALIIIATYDEKTNLKANAANF